MADLGLASRELDLEGRARRREDAVEVVVAGAGGMHVGAETVALYPALLFELVDVLRGWIVLMNPDTTVLLGRNALRCGEIRRIWCIDSARPTSVEWGALSYLGLGRNVASFVGKYSILRYPNMLGVKDYEIANMPILDIDAVQRRLFQNETVRNRLARDYSLNPVPDSPESLTQALLHAFGQAPVQEPLAQAYDNGRVYRAAVYALASNSRPWSTFLLHRARLEELLEGYDPNVVPKFDDLVRCLPGQTGRKDATAILQWRERLATKANYYEIIVWLGARVSELGVRASEVMPLVASFIGDPPAKRSIGPNFAAAYEVCPLPEWKAPGMGAVLASEFLRNLGWSGFKPDRHVKRVLKCWVPDAVDAQRGRARELCNLLGRYKACRQEFLTYSLAGIAVTPADVDYSVADNLIWCLGAYLEKKGRESAIRYFR